MLKGSEGVFVKSKVKGGDGSKAPVGSGTAGVSRPARMCEIFPQAACSRQACSQVKVQPEGALRRIPVRRSRLLLRMNSGAPAAVWLQQREQLIMTEWCTAWKRLAVVFNWNRCWHIPSVPPDCRHLGARRGLVAKFKIWPPPPL